MRQQHLKPLLSPVPAINTVIYNPYTSRTAHHPDFVLVLVVVAPKYL